MPSPYGHPQAGDTATPRRIAVRGASTANISDLTAASTTMDGLTLVAGELVLLKDQTSGAENGVYEVGTVSGGTAALTRYTGFDNSIEAAEGMRIFVGEGTVNADSWWTLTTNLPITLGTTSLTFRLDPVATLGKVKIPLSSFVDLAGTQLTTFADGASDQPGLELTDSELYNIRWNNHAAPLGVMTQVEIPPDADTSADMTVKILASKTGATVGDAVTFDIAAFGQVVGALHDADADFGSTTSAMTGDATSKTVQQVTATLAGADVPAAGANVTLTVTPTAGTLGTDDLHLIAIWVEYTRRAIAA